MGTDRTVVAAAPPVGASAPVGVAGDRRRDPLSAVDRLPVARPAQGFSALLDGAGLLLSLARRGYLGAGQSDAGGAGAPASRAQSGPLVGIIDSQSVPTTESGGPRGIDAAKRIKGRKRHIVTDTEGFLLAAQVHPANIQDPHGAVPLLHSLRQTFPKLAHIFADRVYRGPQLQAAVADCGPWTIEIVERPPGVKGFQLLPRRWVVERSFAWLGRSRRLAKDFEASTASATAWLLLANLRLLSRRLARV
jgi:transposase